MVQQTMALLCIYYRRYVLRKIQSIPDLISNPRFWNISNCQNGMEKVSD